MNETLRTEIILMVVKDVIQQPNSATHSKTQKKLFGSHSYKLPFCHVFFSVYVQFFLETKFQEAAAVAAAENDYINNLADVITNYNEAEKILEKKFKIDYRIIMNFSLIAPTCYFVLKMLMLSILLS